MGIQYFHTYLRNNPQLSHTFTSKLEHSEEKKDTKYDHSTTNNVIVWDCLGWMQRLYDGSDRKTKLLFNFKRLDTCCKKLIDVFNKCGFELVAFIDGYHCKDKQVEKQHRKKEKKRKIQKNINLIKQLHATKDRKQKRTIEEKVKFVSSSGYANYLAQSLRDNGCKIYRGSGENDMDKNIAQFVLNHQQRIYGIMSVDTDYFGFHGLPHDIKLISDYSMNKNLLTLTYYFPSQIWHSLGLKSQTEKLKLICLCGNDFVKKKTRHQILKQCGFVSSNNETKEENENGIDVLAVAADAILTGKVEVNIPSVVAQFYTIATNKSYKTKNNNLIENKNILWCELLELHVFHGGLFFHDLENVGFSIHQKLSDIRHTLIRQKLKLDWIDEYIPIVVDKNIVPYYHQSLNLKEIEYKQRDLNIQGLTQMIAGNDNANMFYVYKYALQILDERKWLTDVQYTALDLQYKLRYSQPYRYGTYKGGISQWPFYRRYNRFLQSGIPRVEDLTAQCLYWECARLICLNINNILPPICKLFNGPLYHFFCFQQVNGEDGMNIIRELKQKLKEARMRNNSHVQKFMKKKCNSQMYKKMTEKKRQKDDLCTDIIFNPKNVNKRKKYNSETKKRKQVLYLQKKENAAKVKNCGDNVWTIRVNVIYGGQKKPIIIKYNEWINNKHKICEISGLEKKIYSKFKMKKKDKRLMVDNYGTWREITNDKKWIHCVKSAVNTQTNIITIQLKKDN